MNTTYAEQQAMLARMVRAREETRKLERQAAAIAAFRVRLRINEDTGLLAEPEEMAS